MEPCLTLEIGRFCHQTDLATLFDVDPALFCVGEAKSEEEGADKRWNGQNSSGSRKILKTPLK